MGKKSDHSLAWQGWKRQKHRSRQENKVCGMSREKNKEGNKMYEKKKVQKRRTMMN
jgi:hypothetical protein